MAKTIQIRVDDYLKDSADFLFESLGLDTSTAVRMFLVASTEAGGIPFTIAHGVNHDIAIRDAITRRKNGDKFFTADEFMARMREAITEGGNDTRL